MTDGELNKFLRHALTIILTLEKYPPEVIDAFCQAFIEACKDKPVGSPYIGLAAGLELVLIPYHQKIQRTEVDAGEVSTDVRIIADKKDYIITKLSNFETQINTISNGDKNIIIQTKLDRKYLFYSGSESDRIKYLDEFQMILSLKPEYVGIITDVIDFVTEIKDLYDIKFDNKRHVSTDISNKKTLVLPIKKAMQTCFFTTCNLNIDNLALVADYFKTNIVDGYERSKDFLYANEYMINVLAGKMQCSPEVKFKHSEILKAENKGLGAAKIFLSTIPNPTTIPDYAQLVLTGEIIEFPIGNIGTATQYYLIIAAVTPGEDVELKLTVK